VSAWLGAGIGYRRSYRAALGRMSRRPSVLEVMPDHFFAEPSEVDELVDVPLVFHDVGMSLGTAHGPVDEVHRARLERVQSLARRAQPLLVTDHLAITRSPSGVDLGHLCPVLPSRSTLAILCDRIRVWQDSVDAPVGLENIAHPFQLEGDFTEAELFCELVHRTGCGMLLDLTNLVLDAKNFGFDPAARLEDYPLEAVLQVHLAGGVRVGGFWVDSHGAAVGRTELTLLARLRGRAKNLRTIIIERDQNLPSLAELLSEAREAERVWSQAPETEAPCPPI
jgi:uncharacterized protein (UPF0276 family)